MASIRYYRIEGSRSWCLCVHFFGLIHLAHPVWWKPLVWFPRTLYVHLGLVLASRHAHTIESVIGRKVDTVEIPVERQGTTYLQLVRAVPEPCADGRWLAALAVLIGRAHALRWPRAGEIENALNR